MTKAVVLCHSVCGNTYLLARAYADTLAGLGCDTALYRLPDERYSQLATRFEASRAYQAAISELPVLTGHVALLDADYIFLGSPTYFGNVSAAVKQFIDGCSTLWLEARLAGKRFGAFASGSTYQGGGDMCLQALNTFAQHMGMELLAVPSNIAGSPQPAYGILHAAGGKALIRPDHQTYRAIADYLRRVVRP